MIMSKYNMFIQNINKNMPNCPICSSGFKILNNSLACKNNHTFNINKKGFVKLTKLQKKYEDLTYTKDLFVSRRQIINDGFYDGIHKTISEIIKKSFQNKKVDVLDVGSGEGSHAKYISDSINFHSLTVTDLNYEAIELATDYLQNGLTPIICDAYNLPFGNDFDVVLNILSPYNYKEVNKVLKDDGLFIKVIPMQNYLKEIRQNNNLDEYKNNQEVIDNLSKHFNIQEQILVEDSFNLTSQQSDKFLNMTPLTKNLKSKQEIKNITISLLILVCKKF